MNKKRIIIVLALVLGLSVSGQKKITWSWISQNIEFKETFFEEAGLWILAPIFSKELKALEGKEIVISGYMMPIDVEMNFYAISANSFANCFFCGGAGPETVMSLDFRDKTLKFKTDDFRTVSGRLQLNEDEIEDAFLNLQDAQLYSDLKDLPKAK